MDGVTNLTAILEQEVAWYANVKGWKAKSHYIEDEKHQIFTVIAVPEKDHPMLKRPGITVMARIVGDNVIIDEDKTDRPLYEALIEAGIPREKIIAAYAGEKLPDENQTPLP